MSLAKATAKNISYLLVARVAFRFLNAAALIYAARYLGNDRYGVFITATAWANAFLALNDIGMSTLLLRVGARNPEKMPVYFGNTLLVESVLSIIIWIALLCVGATLYDAQTFLLIGILAASNLVYEFRKVMRGVFRSHLNLRPVALTEVINGMLFCAATVIIIFTVKNPDAGLLHIAFASLWTDVVCVVALLVITLRILKPKVDLSQLRRMIAEAWPFTIYNLFYMIYFQVDQILISLILTSTAVGVYAAPAQIVTVLLFIPIMVFQVTTPLMYRLSRDDHKKYARVHRIMWRYLSAFGVPAGIGTLLLASPILTTVYGNRYFAHDPSLLAQAVTIMQLFGLFLSIRFIGISHGNALTTSDRQPLRAKIQAVAVACNVLFDIILIWFYGPIGAAISTLCIETITTLLIIVITSRNLNEPLLHITQGLLPIFAATGVMALGITLLKGHFSVILLVVFGAALYLLFLWIFHFFTQKDRLLLAEIFSRRKSILPTQQ